MKLLKYAKGTENAKAGLHIPGISYMDTETLCGALWSEEDAEEIDGYEPTCEACKQIMRELFLERGYTKKQVRSWSTL